jgi:hypothetical protein
MGDSGALWLNFPSVVAGIAQKKLARLRNI